MLTAEQREQRRKYLGSSDYPKLLQTTPFKPKDKSHACDVYWSKIAPLPEEQDSPTYIVTGNRLEPDLVVWTGEQLGVEVITASDKMFRVSKDGISACNHDGLIAGKDEGVEAKFRNGELAQAFGDPGTDQVADDVIIQVQEQMYCSDLSKVWVPLAVPSYYGLEYRLYCVPRDEVLIERMIAFGTEWWAKHVAADPPLPPDPNSGPPMYVLKAMERRKGAEAKLGPAELEATIHMEILKGDIKENKAEVEDLKKFLITSFGDCDSGRLPDNRLLTWYESQASRIDVKALRKELPGVAAEFTKTKASRKFLVRKK